MIYRADTGNQAPRARGVPQCGGAGPAARAPAGTRTLTRTILSRLPLPIGLPGRCGQFATGCGGRGIHPPAFAASRASNRSADIESAVVASRVATPQQELHSRHPRGDSGAQSGRVVGSSVHDATHWPESAVSGVDRGAHPLAPPETTNARPEPGIRDACGYALGREANSSKAARGVVRASMPTRSRRKRKLRIQLPKTRTLRSHIGIARPW